MLVGVVPWESLHGVKEDITLGQCIASMTSLLREDTALVVTHVSVYVVYSLGPLFEWC